MYRLSSQTVQKVENLSPAFIQEQVPTQHFLQRRDKFKRLWGQGWPLLLKAGNPGRSKPTPFGWLFFPTHPLLYLVVSLCGSEVFCRIIGWSQSSKFNLVFCCPHRQFVPDAIEDASIIFAIQAYIARSYHAPDASQDHWVKNSMFSVYRSLLNDETHSSMTRLINWYQFIDVFSIDETAINEAGMLFKGRDYILVFPFHKGAKVESLCLLNFWNWIMGAFSLVCLFILSNSVDFFCIYFAHLFWLRDCASA